MEFAELEKLIKTRRSIRKWKTVAVPEELLVKAIELAGWSPNSGGKQPYLSPAYGSRIALSRQPRSGFALRLRCGDGGSRPLLLAPSGMVPDLQGETTWLPSQISQ